MKHVRSHCDLFFRPTANHLLAAGSLVSSDAVLVRAPVHLIALLAFSQHALVRLEYIFRESTHPS